MAIKTHVKSIIYDNDRNVHTLIEHCYQFQNCLASGMVCVCVWCVCVCAYTYSVKIVKRHSVFEKLFKFGNDESLIENNRIE